MTAYINRPINKTTIGTIAAYKSAAPSSPSAGDCYICTDSPYRYYYDGSAWLAFVFGYQVVEPVLASFTQVKVDLCTFNTAHGGIIMDAASGGEDSQILAQAIPGSGAYYVDAACMLTGLPNVQGLGVGLSGGTATSDALAFGRFGAEGAYNLNWQWERSLKNSATSHNGNAGTATSIMVVGPLLWTRVYDDRTTNRKFYMSMDGYNWIEMYSEARTTLFTPAQGVLVVAPYNARAIAHWVHFSIHA
jgi:hypothetical protein